MYERMLDKQSKPDERAMRDYCGENGARFEALNALLAERYHTSREIRFPYGSRYGWCVTHRLGRKLVCDVFAEAGAFCVMLRLTGAGFAAAYGDVSAAARDAIDHKYPCGDGGWLHYRVANDEALADAERLLAQKLGA